MFVRRAGAAMVALALLGGVSVVTGQSARAATCDGASAPCAIGDTGPGGGVVFYDAGSVKAWGRYLESAPANWKTDPYWIWCDKGKAGYDEALKTGTAIGTGAANTKLIIKACGKDSAAGAASAYRGGSLSDWYLPSKLELNQMYVRRTVVGLVDGITGDQIYWSSSQARKRTPTADLPGDEPTGRSRQMTPRLRGLAKGVPVSAWAQQLTNGLQQPVAKWGAGGLLVRPVRSF